MNRPFLYFTVFASGVTSLALEMSASRLLGSVFGTSNLVWAAIIGLILIYLAAGYFLGGWWADRSPQPRTLYTILAWAALGGGLVPLVAQPVLLLAADAFDQLQVGVLFGAFTSVLVLFSAPVTLLGTVSPFAIRLAISDPLHAGRISGQIYAISTLGSFLGTFLPVLLLIPLVGTNLTFILFSLFLALVAMAGLWLAGGWRGMLPLVWIPLLLFLLGIYLAYQPIKQSRGQIYETESAYNYIQVLELDGSRMLRLNEGQGVHSIWHPEQLNFAGPWESFLAAPFFSPAPFPRSQVRSMAIIGLAAGTAARQATQVFGPIPIDGYEIDPAIIQVGRAYFDMNEPNLNAIAADGRWGLAKSGRTYDLIAIDAYRPPYIPFHLTTREFFTLVRQHLSENGAVAVNVGRSPTDRRLVDGLAATLQTVFPSVYVMDLPDTFNTLIYATARTGSIQDFYQNTTAVLSDPASPPLLRDVLTRVVLNLQPTPSGGQVFTDDRAPIEWITNNMVLNFVLFNDMETLK